MLPFNTKTKYCLNSQISVSVLDSDMCYKKQRQTKGPYTFIMLYHVSCYRSDWRIHSAGLGRSDSAVCKICNTTWMYHTGYNLSVGTFKLPSQKPMHEPIFVAWSQEQRTEGNNNNTKINKIKRALGREMKISSSLNHGCSVIKYITVLQTIDK